MRGRTTPPGKAFTPARVLLGLASLLFLITGVAVVLYHNRSLSPMIEIASVRNGLEVARLAGAPQSAPHRYDALQDSLESARSRIGNESARLFFRRDYEPMRLELIRLEAEVIELTRLCNQRADSLRQEAADSIESAAHDLARSRILAGLRPPEHALHALLPSLALRIEEARSLLELERAEEAAEIARSIQTELSAANSRDEALIRKWRRSFPEWRRWADDAISASRNGGVPSLVVQKLDHTCDLYVDGQVIRTFPVELGRWWIGDKRERGDLTTPEGLYRVTHKLDAGQSRYHKALRLDYPNEDDRRRFDLARQRGELSARAHIGGAIEIHGNGGRGSDWTEGCVALRDEDMDEAFAAIPVDAMVAIVGTLDDSQFDTATRVVGIQPRRSHGERDHAAPR